ncbi:MAG: SAM-dependent methyltransferase [Nanoarchaeota archaeon]|nr:SAM-dependent methyltransferase [Nanoarchaeota archaeon]
MKYIIEHLEPRLYKWCLIEYKHISKIVGKENLIFTKITKKQAEKLKTIGECHEKSVSELDFKDLCILDPAAKKTLTPKDAKDFKYMIFGGILGDYPPRERTSKELPVKNAERRNIGKEQFPTDNAVFVCKSICDGTPMEKMEFQNELKLEIKDGESVEMPFKYVLVNKKPLISEELLKHIKKGKSF